MKNSPARIGTANDWKSVSTVWYSTYAIKTDGSLWAWGINYNCELGDGTTINRSMPVRIGTANDWAVVSAGVNWIMNPYYAIAVKTDGSLWAWGSNNKGQLGDGTITDRHTPVKVLDNVLAVSSGGGHCMVITTDGSLWAWGSNGSGQIGCGTFIRRERPVKIMDGVKLP